MESITLPPTVHLAIEIHRADGTVEQVPDDQITVRVESDAPEEDA